MGCPIKSRTSVNHVGTPLWVRLQNPRQKIHPGITAGARADIPVNINNLLVNEEKPKADPAWFCCGSAVEELLAGTLRADVFAALGWQPQHLLWLQLGWWSLIHPSWSLSVPQAHTSSWRLPWICWRGFLCCDGLTHSFMLGSNLQLLGCFCGTFSWQPSGRRRLWCLGAMEASGAEIKKKNNFLGTLVASSLHPARQSQLGDYIIYNLGCCCCWSQPFDTSFLQYCDILGLCFCWFYYCGFCFAGMLQAMG